MPEDARRVMFETTLPIDLDTETRMVEYFYNLALKIHQDLGYAGAPGNYAFDSWLWKRLAWMNRYHNDFSDRLYLPPERDGVLFRMCNKSLNMPKQFVGGYHAALTSSLDGTTFIEVRSEGSEDTNPALPLLQRYLRAQAERLMLGRLLKNESVLMCLNIGQSVCQVVQKRELRTEPRQVRCVRDLRQPGEVPLRDSNGKLVTELDEWIVNPANPRQSLLKRDTRVFVEYPEGTTPHAPTDLTTRTYTVEHVIRDHQGAVIEFIHPGDFLWQVNKPSLDASDLVGHFTMMAVDDLFDCFDRSRMTAAGKEFERKYSTSAQSGNQGDPTNQLMPMAQMGEDPDSNNVIIDPGALAPRKFLFLYSRYDWNKDNRRERVFCVIDWETRQPVAYDPTSLVLESDVRLHPYFMPVIGKVNFRAYGEGLYEQHDDLSQHVDACWCRIHIEQQSSGKITAFDPNALEQTWAGGSLKLRGPTLWRKRNPAQSINEIIDVKVVPAETQELRENMQVGMQTMTSRGGGMTVDQAESSGLPAANTLGGLQLLERQRGRAQNSTAQDLRDSHQDLLRVWAQVERDCFDMEFAQELFGDLMIDVELAQPGAEAVTEEGQSEAAGEVTEPDGVTETAPLAEGLSTMKVPAAQVLQQFLRTVKPDMLANMVKIVLTDSTESEEIAQTENRKKIILDYMQLGSVAAMQATQEEFTDLLKRNGSNDAEKTIAAIQSAQLQQEQAQQMAAQQQAEMQARQQAGGLNAPRGGPPTQDPTEEAPLTGRPESMKEFNPGPGPVEPLV
jgi:hypothetical protein